MSVTKVSLFRNRDATTTDGFSVWLDRRANGSILAGHVAVATDDDVTRVYNIWINDKTGKARLRLAATAQPDHDDPGGVHES
jgi:hypothetical protein